MIGLDALAKFFLGVLEQKTVQKWAKLVFELLCSGLLTFLFVFGSVLVVPPHSWAIATGSGSVTAAICMTVVFRRSPLTKSLLLVLPSEEAAKEIATDIQVIERR